jgi:acetoin utilization deacetylase AcuC-like enzyme
MYTVYTDRHKLHATDGVDAGGIPLDSYDLPARAQILVQAVQQAQTGPVIAPSDHGLAPVLTVHDADYVHFLRHAFADSADYLREAGPVFTWTFAPRHALRKPRGFLGLKGYYAFGWGTPVLEGTWEAAYWSAQCALTAADLVRGGQRVAYALCRPPGHHAAVDLFGGYCYLNNAAIVARVLQTEGKVAVLDVDYHHGNGTQLIFYTDPMVLYCSLHVHPDEDYPYYWGDVGERGQGPGLGTNCNWPLPRGTGDGIYLSALDQALVAIREFAPRYLVVSLGFDTVDGDPEGGFCLTTDGLGEVGRRIAGLGLPTVLVQEGGYLLDRLGDNAVAFLQAFVTRKGA